MKNFFNAVYYLLISQRKMNEGPVGMYYAVNGIVPTCQILKYIEWPKSLKGDTGG